MGGGPVREWPDLGNTYLLRRFQVPNDPKKVRIWEVAGGGGVRSGNGPTSEIRALYGVFRPKKTQKRYVFGRSAGGGGSGPGTARPPKYVPFTAFSSPKKNVPFTASSGLKTAQKRYVFGRSAGGGGVRSGNGPTSEIRALYGVFRPKKTPKRYVFGRSAGGGVRGTALTGPKRPKKGTYLGGRGGGGGGPVQERPDLRNTCPLRRFQAQKDPKKVRIWEVGGRGVRSGNGPTSEIRALCSVVFRPKKTQKRYVFGSGGRGGSVRPKKTQKRYVFGRSVGGGASGPGPKRPKKGTYLGGRRAGGGGPVGNGPTSEIRAFYGVFRPKKTTYLGGRRPGGGSGPGMARPRRYVPFTAFSGPKRPKKGSYLGGRRAGGGVRSGNGPTSEIRALYGVFKPKKTQKRYVFGRSAAGGGPVRERPDLRNTCPLRRFQAQKDPKKVRIWEVGGPVRSRPDLRNTCPLQRFQAQKDPKKVRIWEVGGRGGVRSGNGPFQAQKDLKKVRIWEVGGRGGGPVRERPDLRNTCPLRRFQAQKDPKKVRIWEVGGRGGVRSGNGPTSEIRALYGVFRPKRPKKGTYLGGRRASGVQDRLSVSKCFSRSALRYSSLLS